MYLPLLLDSSVHVESEYTTPEHDRTMFVFFQAEDGIRDGHVTGVQTCALPISGIRPLKPRPKAAETAMRPSSFWLTINPEIAVAWASEPTSTVLSPPTRSVIQPQNCRLKKAHTKSRVSMAGPCAGAKPRSPQSAIKCDAGIAIGTQQRKAAAARRPKARLRGRPKTVSRGPGACAVPPALAVSGAGCKNISASGTTTAATMRP